MKNIQIQQSFFCTQITPSEIESKMLYIPNKKAYGLYSCPTKILKCISNVVSKPFSEPEIHIIQTNQHHRQPSKNLPACYSCGSTEHARTQCRFRNVICSRCKRTGHIARVCRRGTAQNNRVEQNLSRDEVFADRGRVIYDF